MSSNRVVAGSKCNSLENRNAMYGLLNEQQDDVYSSRRTAHENDHSDERRIHDTRRTKITMSTHCMSNTVNVLISIGISAQVCHVFSFSAASLAKLRTLICIVAVRRIGGGGGGGWHASESVGGEGASREEHSVHVVAELGESTFDADWA